MKRTKTSLEILMAVALAGTISTVAQAGTCTINLGSLSQTIDGFGFSSAWSGQLSQAQMDGLMGTGSGQCGFSLLRVRIDPNKNWAEETANAAKAHAKGLKVLGSPWSPPAYMKDNNNVVHGSLLASQYSAYASYLNQAANTIGLDYVSIQNEPDWNPDYEGCVWTPTQLLTFTKNNAQAIGRPVVMPEGLGFNDAYSDPTLNDATAANNVSVVGGHFYGGGNYVHQNAINHGKRVWMTEHYFTGSDIGTCMGIAKEVSDAMNNQFNAYFWWWTPQGDGATLLSGSTPLKNAYTIGQFSKWVRPGAQRVSTTYNPSADVYVTAYNNSGNLVIVAVNIGTGVNQQFTVQNGAVGSVTPFRTSATENMAALPTIAVSSGSFTATLPTQSVTTFVQNSVGDPSPAPVGGNAPANGTYRIVARNSSKAMSVANSSTNKGGQIWQWTYLSGNNQKWTVTDVGNGQYSIVGVQSGRALTIGRASTADGAQAQVSSYRGNSNQKFTFAPTDSGYYTITPTHAPGSCLDVANASNADGALVQLWSCWGGTNQQWMLETP